MSSVETFSIIDFGSSKLRLGVFNTYLPNSRYILEESYKNDDSIKEKLKNLVLQFN